MWGCNRARLRAAGHPAGPDPSPCCAYEQAALQPGSCCRMGGIKGNLVCLLVVIQNYLSRPIIEEPQGVWTKPVSPGLEIVLDKCHK